MLWIYVNSTGTIECSVNVGNRIRQGDPFDVFLVLYGMNGEAGAVPASTFSLNYVKYVNPDMRSFAQDGVEIDAGVAETFVLGNPSQVNTHFVNGEQYNGYLVRIPAQATSFSSNGGNVGLEIGMLSNGDATFEHAQTANIFVEGTYGKKPTLMTSSDYALLLSMIREANFTLTFPLSIPQGAGVSVEDGDELPTITLTKSIACIGGEVTIDRDALSDSVQSIAGTEHDGYATIAYFDSANVSLKYPANISGIDEDGNVLQLRVIGANNSINRINVDLLIEQEGASQSGKISFFGACPIEAEYLVFAIEGQRQGKLITDANATATTLAPSSNATASVSVADNLDADSATLSFSFGIPQGVKGDDGSPAGIGTASATATTTTVASGNDASVTVSASTSGSDLAKDFSFSFDFSIPQGADGVVTESSGLIGFQVDSNGQLIAYTSGSDPAPLSIDANGQLIYTY